MKLFAGRLLECSNFHDRVAATGNARSPRLDRLVAGTNRTESNRRLGLGPKLGGDLCRRYENRWGATPSPEIFGKFSLKMVHFDAF